MFPYIILLKLFSTHLAPKSSIRLQLHRGVSGFLTRNRRQLDINRNRDLRLRQEGRRPSKSPIREKIKGGSWCPGAVGLISHWFFSPACLSVSPLSWQSGKVRWNQRWSDLILDLFILLFTFTSWSHLGPLCCGPITVVSYTAYNLGRRMFQMICMNIAEPKVLGSIQVKLELECCWWQGEGGGGGGWDHPQYHAHCISVQCTVTS